MNANDFGTVEDLGMEMDWNDEIEKESSFILLPAGDYDFTVSGFERARFDGSEKMGPCNMAKITIDIESKEGIASIQNRLFLNRKCEGILCSFFGSIGQRKHGEKLKMDWTKVIGSRGRAKIGTRTYNGKEYNDIKQFIYPDDSTQSQENKSFKPGTF